MIQELEALAAKWSRQGGSKSIRVACASELRAILAKHKKPRDEREWCERNGKRPVDCMWWSADRVAPRYENDPNVLPIKVAAHMRRFRFNGSAAYESEEAAYADLRTGLIAAGEIEPPATYWHCPVDAVRCRHP